MRLSSILLIFGLVSFLVLFGCVKSASQLPQSDNFEEQLAACESIPSPSPLKDKCFQETALRFKESSACGRQSNITSIDACYQGLATSSNDVSFCTLLSNDLAQDDCVNSVASQNNNAGFCLPIKDVNKQKACFDSLVPLINVLPGCDPLKPLSDVYLRCVQQVAEVTKDAKACDSLSTLGSRDACLSSVAQKLSDATLCQSISDPTIRNECIGKNIGSNISPSTCPLVPNASDRETCYQQLASKLKDASYCDNIVTLSTFNACVTDVANQTNEELLCTKLKPVSNQAAPKDACFNTIAQAKKELSICYQIESGDLLRSCVGSFSGSSSFPANCKDAASSDQPACYANQALRDQNVLICQNSTQKVDCVSDYAVALKKLNACNDSSSFLTFEQRLNCQSNYYVGVQDINSCSTIPSGYWKADCVSRLAAVVNDESYCEGISSYAYLTQYSNCWSSLASVRKDLALCDLALDQFIKASCYGKVGFLVGEANVCKKLPVAGLLETDRFAVQNQCWSQLAQTSQSEGYCYEIDQNSLRDSCLCLFGDQFCKTGNSLRVTASIPAGYPSTGLTVSVYRDFQVFNSLPLAIDTNSAIFSSLPDGNYSVLIVDNTIVDGNLITDYQSVELMNRSSMSLSFQLRVAQ